MRESELRRHVVILALLAALTTAPGSVFAQVTIGSLQPRSCRPGETTRLVVRGKGFSEGLRAATSHAGATVVVESAEPQQATLDVTVPADAPLGPMGLWLASADGPSEPFVVMVDDLPTVAEAADNHTFDSAQPLETLAAVDGVSKAGNSAFYRIDVAAGQRVAVEVLTQPLESKMDPVVRLLDANGQTLLLVDDDDVGPDCRFAYRFTAEGPYVIEVRDNRYAAAGSYRLRIGDFPIVRHAFPLVIAAGQTTRVRFCGLDGDRAESRDMAPATGWAGITTIAARLPAGRSSAWVPIRVTDKPLHVAALFTADRAARTEGEKTAPAVEPQSSVSSSGQPLTFPILISGRLSEPDQRDRYPIQGIQGVTIRASAVARSLGCPSLPRMRLLAPADAQGVEAQVAETKVDDTDEWSFDYAFPDDGVYQLEVADLLTRGGDDFGYAIEITSAGSFALQLKPDAASRQQFAIEAGGGAAAIDVQVLRFGYDGAIDVSLAEPQDGLRILNSRIPAATNDARIYLAADANWTSDAFALIGLRGQASENLKIAASVNSLAWQRLIKPHVPFPIHWNNGEIQLSGVAPTTAYFSLEPLAPLRLARSMPSHSVTLNLKRTDKAFKGAVTLLADSLPEGWQAEIKADADTYAVTWTCAADAVTTPETLRLLAFAEHGNRGRIESIELSPQWYDPLKVSIRSDAAPASESNNPSDASPLISDAGGKRLIAGQKTTLVACVERHGDDPQPVTLTFSPAAGLGLPESLTVPADQRWIEFDVTVADDISLGDANNNGSGDGSGRETLSLAFAAASTHQGDAFTISGHSSPLLVVEAPVSIDVYPQEIQLSGSKDRHQLVVTGYDASGTPRDWTAEATLSSANPAVAEVRGSVIFATGNGETQIILEVGGKRHEISTRVSGADADWHTAFESEVLVALSKQGCNSGACHGSPSGKGMFRLSLRAFDAKLDELTLIREDYGRRINLIDPEQSLLLLKPLMKVSHGGGRQLQPDDEAYAILRDWIAEGAPSNSADTARCVRLEVVPAAKRVLRLEDGVQQLAAAAHFSDGSRRDVTHLVAYESSDTSVARVDANGVVTPQQRGEAVILVRYLEHIESVPLMFIQQVPDFVWQTPPPNNYVDELVNAKLLQLQYVPAETCSDAEFLRRVHLDIVGILPSLQRSREFLADESPDKRSRLIDELLQREEFAKFWALKWGDLLKMTGKLIGDDGVYKYHRWVEEAFRTNMPYDEFARQLLTTSGSTLANPAANFYRTATDMNECVENVSQVFLGARLQCAQCHNHPFERWTQDNYYGMGAFFHRVQRRKTQRPGELFVWTATSGDVIQPRTGEQMKPWLPSLGTIEIGDEIDRREPFTQWLIDPENPYFAKMEVNRIWAQLFARGIVDPIDDFRDSNPPSNEALLDALAKDFVHSGFDRRHILRVILSSRTYQASYHTTPLNRDDSQYFSHQQPRLLHAEQLLDAINHVLGLQESFGNLPAETMATHLPAPDLIKIDFLKVFGQSERSTVCACERVEDSNLGMAIELFNGSTIHNKLRAADTRFRVSITAGKPLAEVIQEMYLAAFCRHASKAELAAAIAHCEKQDVVLSGLEDVAWALLNTDEFLFQH